MGYSELTYRNKITYLSFILSILVVIKHSVNIDVYNLSQGMLFWLQTWACEFTDLAVPIFFIISGYLFYQNFGYSVLKRKLRSRFFGLVIPYCIWNLIAYFYYELIYNIPMIRSHINQTVEPFTLFYILKNTLWGGYNITWFLRYLILFTVVSPLLYPIMRKRISGIAVIVSIYIIDLFYDTRLVRFGAIYLFGMWLGCNYSGLMKQVRNVSRMRIFICVIYLVISTIGMLLIPNDCYKAFYIPIRISQFICVWSLSDLLAVEKKPCWIFTISFFIYCTHSPVLESVEKVFLILFGKNNGGALVDFALAPLVTVLIISIIAWFLRKYPKTWGILTGNR